MVPVAVLQEAFVDSGTPAPDIARALGWTRVVPDTSRVYRQLGIAATQSHGRAVKQATVGYDRAVELVRAMGLDPVDYSL